MTRPVTIGLLWHSLENDNLGVGALTLAQVEILRAAAARAGRSIRLLMLGWSGRMDYGGEVPELAGRTVPGQALKTALTGGTLGKAIRECDVVLDIGGGDSFTDIYPSRRFFWMCLSKQLVLRAGVPLVLAPQTIGPFTGRWSRIAARRLMRRAKTVWARDGMSMAVLDDMGVGAPAAREAIDVAFRLPYTPREVADDGKIDIGLNVSGLMWFGGYSGKNELGLTVDYQAVVTRFIEALKDRDDIRLHLVPHVIGHPLSVDNDDKANEALAERFPWVSVARSFSSPVEAKSWISGLHLLLGARMHATIAACSAGVAAVPMAYSRKFNGLYQSLAYPLVADCRSGTTESVLELALGAVDQWQDLRTAARAAHARALEKLAPYEDYLADLLAKLPA